LLFNVTQSAVTPLLENYTGRATEENFIVDDSDVSAVGTSIEQHLAQAQAEYHATLTKTLLAPTTAGGLALTRHQLAENVEWSLLGTAAPIEGWWPLRPEDMSPRMDFVCVAYWFFMGSEFAPYFTEQRRRLDFLGVTLQEHYLMAVFLWCYVETGLKGVLRIATASRITTRLNFLRAHHSYIHFELYGSEDYRPQQMGPMMRLSLDQAGHVVLPDFAVSPVGKLLPIHLLTGDEVATYGLLPSAVDSGVALGACAHCLSTPETLLCEAAPSRLRFCQRDCQQAFYDERNRVGEE